MRKKIKTDAGRTVGQWSGESAEELQAELSRIGENLHTDTSRERLVTREMPHRKQLPEDLHGFRAYHAWSRGHGDYRLVGTHANRIEPLDRLRA